MIPPLTSSTPKSPTAPGTEPLGNGEQAPSWPTPTTPQPCVHGCCPDGVCAFCGDCDLHREVPDA